MCVPAVSCAFKKFNCAQCYMYMCCFTEAEARVKACSAAALTAVLTVTRACAAQADGFKIYSVAVDLKWLFAAVGARLVSFPLLSQHDNVRSFVTHDQLLIPPPPRATINRYGFNSLGADAVADNLLLFEKRAREDPSAKTGACSV